MTIPAVNIARFLIAIEGACLIAIGWPAYIALTWEGSENWGVVAVLIYGLPALGIQWAAMAGALIALARSDLEPDDRSLPRQLSLGLAAIGLFLVAIVILPITLA